MAETDAAKPQGSVGEVFRAFLILGFTAFGGPVAHLGYFREAFVARRRWLDEAAYADLVALCQFLPGPASSQVGIALGLTRAGLGGALAAWLAFTLPSALLLVAVGYGATAFGGLDSGILHGLKIVAVAVVAQAVLGMGRSLCPDRERASLAVAAAVLLLLWSSPWAQILVILAGALFGAFWLKLPAKPTGAPLPVTVGRGAALACLAAFFLLLAGLPLLAGAGELQSLALFDVFYRAGALVFGGGHVVLPLLQAEVGPPGWVSNDLFLAGYGAAQAVPGPLFPFAAYLGTVSAPPNGWLGAAIALLGIFLPAWLLVLGTLPFWNLLRGRPGAQSVLAGVNAAVVGLLLAALYDPIFTSAIRAPADLALAAVAFGLLAFWKVPPWLVVVLTALGGGGLAALD